MASQQYLLNLSNKLATLDERLQGLEAWSTSHSTRLQTIIDNPQLLKDGMYSSGDTSFMILCCALVFLMAAPGVGLYYSGMVHVQNVIDTAMQAFTTVAIVTCVYFILGYTLAFGPAAQGTLPVQHQQHSSLYYGDASRAWLIGLGQDSVHQSAGTIPESVYCVYQLLFAIMTATLASGSIADRIKYTSLCVFLVLWHISVYCPVAHAAWHPDGFLHQAGVMDFAGGNVVHICSGCTGLAATVLLGNKRAVPNAPHNALLTFIGASLLIVGWIGFTAGSAYSANANAGMAALNTLIGSSMGSLSWMLVDTARYGHSSLLGLINGAVAGLVVITPACGWVDQTGAFFMGLLAGPWCAFFAQVKHYAGYDDALDAFGVHATGGLLGGLLTGFFANPTFYGPFIPAADTAKYSPGVFYAIGKENQGAQLGRQAYACSVTLLYSTVASALILKLIDLTIGLRRSELDDLSILDASSHLDASVSIQNESKGRYASPPSFASSS